MRVLITGVTGFVGSHMAEYLLTLDGVEVFGLYRWRSRMDNLADLNHAGKLNPIPEESTSLTSPERVAQLIAERARPHQLNLIEGDMLDAFSMYKLIGGLRPDRIFHLAAQSWVPGSQTAPALTLQTNIMGQLNIFEAVRQVGIDPQVHIAGSSEEYGLVKPEETPIKETNPLRPLSPYGVSKVAQEMLAYQYHQSFGLRTVVTRGFNHTGPRRGQLFVTSGRAKQIAEIELGLRPPVLYVGDQRSKRDFTDVRDMVRAYWLSLERGRPGEVYNVGTGVAWEIGEMQDLLLGMTEAKIEVEVDPARLRPSDVTLLVGDASKFRADTGWEPRIPFEQTLLDLLNYWRERLRG
ncbi:MAG: GDP-mannose 4,6-dehydratase [Chloroflexi bacterium]|nr:GDP-mannose 4,6-dehydratase [Chloroflexota bacterium]